MKKVQVGIAVMLIIHLALLGCNVNPSSPDGGEQAKSAVDPGRGLSPADETSLVTFWIDGDEVNVTGYERDTVNQELIMSITREKPGGESLQYNIVFEKTIVEDGIVYNGAHLEDCAGNLIVGIDFAWPTADFDPNWYSVTERTPSDEMSIRRELRDGMVTESYDLNGEVRTYSYADNLPSIAKYRPEDDGSNPPVTEGELPLRDAVTAELQQWEELTSPDNTLNSNEDGEFFMGVLSNSVFIAWLEAEFQNTGPLNRAMIGSDDAVCAIATLVGVAKCAFGGGFLNFLCIAATGTGIACAIGVIGRWIHGWD